MATDYLNWENLLVNELSGSLAIFTILAMVVLLYICARLRFPNQVTIMIMCVFLLFMSAFYSAILPIILLVIAIFISLIYNYLINR